MAIFILLSFLISPIVSFLGNPSREMALIFVIMVVFFYNLKSTENYFELLHVTPHHSVDAIKKSFKSEALNLHPDRNASKTASRQYVTLASIYKTLVNDEKREAYSRYGDLFQAPLDKLIEMNPSDVLYVILMNTASGLIGMFITIMVHGGSVINTSALLYELFCFALDVYLRFAPDASNFMAGVPILRYYTIFELIAFLRSFRVLFIYYSNILESDSVELPMKSGTSILRNNILAIETLDDYLANMNILVTSEVPLSDQDIAWRGQDSVGEDYEKRWEEEVKHSSEGSKFYDEDHIETICGRRDRRNILWFSWNRGPLKRLLKRVVDIR
ncbi:uncharacterized protein BXIN_0491 [Babesia sp. Xinjiang]|uniref:uncharacterized protein n=1 Tax=Babesia sp. Xinjiang TaxID=462227 RepID=UPI000A23C919|nr:uncharacterized protein BXIN_0491 [Babesia sp. Xinjiang]ORM41936.1 hypothetical protein BXIN_0491 [Babesia sp. Xinjiang]